jgi:Tol biopolymer transport system component
MSGTITWYMPDGSTQAFSEKVWLSPLDSRYRVELSGDTENTLKLSDGSTIYNVNLNSMLAEQSTYPDFARVGQYVPPVQAGMAYPNPIWGQIGTPLSEMAFPANFAQSSGTFTPLAMDAVAGRPALIVEWTFSGSPSPSWKAWLDTQTAVILKTQEFGKEGSNTLQGERVVESILFDQVFDASLFVPPTGLAQSGNPVPAGSNPVLTESSPMVAEEAGELYFFLQPRRQGESIQLVKVSGMCVSDSANCPPMEKISVPFPFNFTINALAWSPDGKFAAFSYSDAPNGTPTKLWLFDAEAQTWKSLAQAPYIDPPFWSPDGAWIAVRTQDGVGGEELFVVRQDGSELKSISASLPVDGRPYVMDGWFGDRIIMHSALNGTMILVRAADGMVSPMLTASIAKAQFVASPDSNWLAFDEFDAVAETHQLKVMQPDGSNAVTVAQFLGGSIYPIVWSPDGNLVAFNYYSGFMGNEPKAEVYVVTRGGENLSLVYTGTTVSRLLFSPNGQYLLVEETTSISGGHLFLIDLATLEQKMLQAPGLSTEYDWYAPSWRP